MTSPSPSPDDMGRSVAWTTHRITGSPVLAGIAGGVVQYLGHRGAEHAAKRNHAAAEGCEFP
jgi:hypothetical protein